MKIYTTHFNANQPSNKQINIPNHSTAKIGIAVEKNGQIIELSGTQVNLVDGDNVISCDDVYNGYATFPIATGNDNEDKNFILSCDKGYEIEWHQVCDISTKYGPGLITFNDNQLCSEFLSMITGKRLYPQSVKMNVVLSDDTVQSLGSFSFNNSSKNNIWTAWVFADGTGFWRPRSGVGQTDRDYIVYPDDFYDTPDYIGFRWSAKQKGNKGKAHIDVLQGEPFKSNFNLRVNSDKSTVFDKTDVTKDNVKDIMSKKTMVLTGTYVDDTPFQFTIPAI